MRTPIMATRGSVLHRDEEAELVVVDTDTDGAVVIELDDGGRLELDEVELRAALERRAA
jgi:hypothetical protein